MSFKRLNFDALARELDKHKFRQLHIHHTWKPAHSSFKGNNHTQMQQSMKNYHVNTNGWSDIGQHLTLFPDGVWLTGRSFNRTPASIKGWNTGALCVEMVGNFDTSGTGSYNNLGYDTLQGRQKQEILNLIRYFLNKYGANSIKFHRENSTKTCPGTSLNKQQLINEARGISTSTPSTPTVNTRLVKRGSRGSHVSTLQSNLNKLGLDAGTSDGIAGAKTVKAMRDFQHRYRLSVDGIFGKSSFDKLDDVLKNLGKFRKSASGKSEYMDIDDAQVIRTKPENIEIKVVGNSLHQANISGVNGTFFDTHTAPVTSPNSCVFIAMDKGKAISNNAQFNGWKAPARATVIYQKDKQMGFRQLKDINPIRNIAEWALGGHMVKPYMDFKNEKVSGAINYKTAHTYLGYDKDSNIYLIVKPNHMIREIVPLLDKLKITNAIVLDGGGSSQLRHSMGNFTSNRRVNTVVSLIQE